MQISPSISVSAPEIPPKPEPDSPLMQKARDLEAAFLAEMLSYAGLGDMPESGFGGGIGEEQFGSFLRQAQAVQLVQRGGIGLAEHLFHAMTKGESQ